MLFLSLDLFSSFSYLVGVMIKSFQNVSSNLDFFLFIRRSWVVKSFDLMFRACRKELHAFYFIVFLFKQNLNQVYKETQFTVSL